MKREAYLKLADLEVGLLINFNGMVLTEGIQRIVNQFGRKT
jgi:hypothetical protein